MWWTSQIEDMPRVQSARLLEQAANANAAKIKKPVLRILFVRIGFAGDVAGSSPCFTTKGDKFGKEKAPIFQSVLFEFKGTNYFAAAKRFRL
jgi:hypothetical protein